MNQGGVRENGEVLEIGEVRSQVRDTGEVEE